MRMQKLGFVVIALGAALLIVGLIALDTPLLVAGGAALLIGAALVFAAFTARRRRERARYAAQPAPAAPDPQVAQLRRRRASPEDSAAPEAARRPEPPIAPEPEPIVPEPIMSAPIAPEPIAPIVSAEQPASAPVRRKRVTPEPPAPQK